MTSNEEPADKTKKKYRSTKNAYYMANAVAINKAKLIKALVAGKRSPSLATLERYGLLDKNADGYCPVVTIPNRPKFKVLDNFAKPDIIVVRPQNIITPTQIYDDSNTEITGKQITSWILTKLSTIPKADGKVRSAKTIGDYSRICYNLSAIRGKPYDENDNILAYFKNATETIEKVKQHQIWIPATQAKFLGGMLCVMQNFEPLKNALRPDIITIYNAAFQTLSGIGSAAQLQRKENTRFFIWSYIRKCVRDFYGAESYQYLVVLLYQEILGRDDMGMTMAYKSEDTLDESKNYLFLDREHKKATAILNVYKTSGAYGKDITVLKHHTYNLIVTLHPDNSKKTLFPFKSKLSKWIISFFAEIPQLKDEHISIRYIRKSVISSALYEIKESDPNFSKKIQDLAEKAHHSIKAQQQSYKAKLKDGNGKPIDVERYIPKKAYDEPTLTNVNINEAAGDEEEEISSSKKPKRCEALMKIAEEPPKKVVVPVRKSSRIASKKK